MEDLRRVKHNGEIIIIDANKEPDRQTKYLHAGTGFPFEGFHYQPEKVKEQKEEMEAEAVEELQTQGASDYQLDASDMEALWTEYKTVTGKNVPARYKNDAQRLKGKILSC